MGKDFVIETEEFHRVWNFVVPLNKIHDNGHIQSIPLLTNNSFGKNRRKKTRKSAC
jgi:hypothetical protein